MDKEFIEIEETLKKVDSELNGYQKKINDIKQAIEILEAENIALPESAYGTLAYYQSEFDKESKAYQQLVGLRNKIRINCKHEYMHEYKLRNGEMYQECKYCGNKRYI